VRKSTSFTFPDSAAKLKAKQDEQIAGYTDLLNTSTDEKEKALARDAIAEIENDRLIASTKELVAKEEAEIDKKIALVKLSIKKSQLEADFQIKFAELQANESAAIADASGIRRKSERNKQIVDIRQAYGSAYAAIGKAATSTGASLELERKSITGGLSAEDFADSQSDASQRVKALEQPIVITIDGKTVAETVAGYGINELVEFTKGV
jgi:hypothetical protein